MRDKYLLVLVVLLFIVGIVLFLQMSFLLEKPRSDVLILENNELKKAIKGLLTERASTSCQIMNLEKESKMKDEQINLLLSKKPKEVFREVEVIVSDPNLLERVSKLEEERKRLILENEHFNKINKEMDGKIEKASNELSRKEDEIKSLKTEIENKENEKKVIMAEAKDAFLDEESKERLESLERDKIVLTSRILSFQDEIAELSKKKEELGEHNSLILKEKDNLKEKLVLMEEEKKRLVEALKKQIEDILKKKEEDVSKIQAEKDDEVSKLLTEKENEKKTTHKKSMMGNLLSMFLLWKK